MSNKRDNDSRLDTPIYLDYDVNILRPIIRLSHVEMLETIKGYFEKHGFKKKEKTDEGFIIFEKPKKRENHVG